MLLRILQVLVPLLTAAVFSSRLASHLSAAWVATNAAPSNSMFVQPWCWSSTNLAASFMALSTVVSSVRADTSGSYSYINQDALRRQREKQQQQQRQQKQQQQQKQHRYQQHQQQQQTRQRFYHQQGHPHFNPFGSGGNGGFQQVFEQLFGGGGPGGFQFTFNGQGMPFGAGGMPFGREQPPSYDDDSANPKFIRKALKAFGLDESCDMKELKKKYRNLALKYHPDKCGKEPTCEEKMVKVNRYKDAIEKWLKRRG